MSTAFSYFEYVHPLTESVNPDEATALRAEITQASEDLTYYLMTLYDEGAIEIPEGSTPTHIVKQSYFIDRMLIDEEDAMSWDRDDDGKEEVNQSVKYDVMAAHAT